MRDFRNAKAMAKTLRDQLAGRSHDISHSDSLELIAQVLGARNWQTLAAAIEASAASAPATAILLPLIPIRDLVVFPTMTLPLFVARPRTLRAVERAMAGDKQVFLVAQRGEAVDAPAADDLFEIGVVATILEVRRDESGALKLVVRAGQRARLARLAAGELLEAEIDRLDAVDDGADPATDPAALAHEALQRFSHFANFDLADPPIALANLCRLKPYPGPLADAIGPHVATRLDQTQDLLETLSPAARLRRLIALMDEARPMVA